MGFVFIQILGMSEGQLYFGTYIADVDLVKDRFLRFLDCPTIVTI